MRSFIRHPSDVPIDYQLDELVAEGTDFLKNVSRGGLAFHSRTQLNKGAMIRIIIPLTNPVFEALGRVSWCEPEDQGFEIGIEFADEDDVFRARMVEQICYIEQYKQDILEKEGRKLTGEEAAAEWINEYATGFPDIEDG